MNDNEYFSRKYYEQEYEKQKKLWIRSIFSRLKNKRNYKSLKDSKLNCNNNDNSTMSCEESQNKYTLSSDNSSLELYYKILLDMDWSNADRYIP